MTYVYKWNALLQTRTLSRITYAGIQKVPSASRHVQPPSFVSWQVGCLQQECMQITCRAAQLSASFFKVPLGGLHRVHRVCNSQPNKSILQLLSAGWNRHSMWLTSASTPGPARHKTRLSAWRSVFQILSFWWSCLSEAKRTQRCRENPPQRLMGFMEPITSYVVLQTGTTSWAINNFHFALKQLRCKDEGCWIKLHMQAPRNPRCQCLPETCAHARHKTPPTCWIWPKWLRKFVCNLNWHVLVHPSEPRVFKRRCLKRRVIKKGGSKQF